MINEHMFNIILLHRFFFVNPYIGISCNRGYKIKAEGTGDMGCLAVFYPGFVRVGEELAMFFEETGGVSNLPTKPGTTYIEMLYKNHYLYIIGTDPMMVVPDVNSLKEANFIVV